MNIWLIMSGEPLALYGERPHRVGVLSEMLTKKGHKVTWWTTTFDHQNKSYFYDKYTKVDVGPSLDMFFLHSDIEYKKNISIARVFNHKQVSNCFISVSGREEIPDLIFCAFPTIDLAYQATLYGKRNNVPVIIDVRDLWPDIFLDSGPDVLRPLGRFLLSRYFRQTKYIFSNCTAITAVSDRYLDWAIEYSNRPKGPSDRVFPLGYQEESDGEFDFKSPQLSFQKIGLNESKLLVWFVGTFGQTYNLSTVIKAARELQDRDDIQFILTGDGEKMEEWSRLAEGMSNVIFTGWVDKLGLAYLSHVSSIGLMSYRNGAPQGLPNKIFEYLAAGLPILSSLQTETKNLLRSEAVGYTYSSDDVGDFLANLKLLVDDKGQLKDMGERARALFEARYSSSTIYGNMIDYFHENFV